MLHGMRRQHPGGTLVGRARTTLSVMWDSAPYCARLRTFLRRRGFAMMCFPCRPEIYAGATYIATGNSPRPRTEGGHSVVMHGRKMIHDPHRSGKGILSHDWTWLILPDFSLSGLRLYAPKGKK